MDKKINMDAGKNRSGQLAVADPGRILPGQHLLPGTDGYIGYASMQGHQTPQDVLKYRYGGNFTRFGGKVPSILYHGYGQQAKDTGRGLEQRFVELHRELGGVANKRNPVGEHNPRRTEYLEAADEYLEKNKINLRGKCYG